MTQKIYKTARGKTIDMGALAMKNQHVRAVSNMSVNARGDLIDSNNNIVDRRSNRIVRQYDRQTSNVSSTPVATSNVAARKARSPYPTQVSEAAAPATPQPVKQRSSAPQPDIESVSVSKPTQSVPVAPIVQEVVEENSKTNSRLAASITAAQNKQ